MQGWRTEDRALPQSRPALPCGMLWLHLMTGLLNFAPRTDLNPSIPLCVLLVILQKSMGYVRVYFQIGGSSFWCTEEGGIHCDLGTEEASLGGDMK